jgi:hypothetical protein
VTTAELERASTAAPRPELDWERDWQGRPRILPDPTWTPDTAPPGWVQDGKVLESREYTRVTTHAEALQDSSALTRWKMRRAVLGMGRRPDYVVTAASLTAEDRDRDALDDLAEKALEASGPNAADVGTALHAFTDRIDRGEELGHVPEEYRPTLDAYTRAVSHLRFVEWECRTVCDELEAAGTPDRLGFCDIPDPDGVTDALRIIDTKTGRVDYSAGKFSTQLGIYRRSRKYHPGTGERTSWEQLHGAPVSRWGLVVHVPAGAGTAELLWIDLEHGDHGAEVAQQVRRWRQGATAGNLLRPVFARPPRPATTDGTCRGRKQDGQPCGYKRKSKQEGLGAYYCGRHQDQAADLERWLAENPDADPDGGEDTLPSRTPVQPSFPPVEPVSTQDMATLSTVMGPGATAQDMAAAVPAVQADRPAGDPRPPAELRATPEQEAAYLAGALISTRTLPNGHLMAPVGAVAVSPDGVRWVKVQRSDVFGWEREDRVLEAGGPENLRCQGTGLPVTQCACTVHRPEYADLATAAYERAREAAAVTPDPERRVRELPPPSTGLPPFTLPAEHMAAVSRGEDPDAAEQEQYLDVLREVAPSISLEEMEEDRRSALAEAGELDGDDSYPDYGPEDDAAAAMGLPSQTAGTYVDADQPAVQQFVREQTMHPEPPVGTYATDPATEQNGNRRPVSGLQTPEDAGHALRTARAGLFDQIDACRSQSELELLWKQHAGIWTQPHTDRVTARLAQLQAEQARERPEAALLAALETAPDTATLERLWQQYRGGGLWTQEAAAAAHGRWTQLQNLAQL